MLIRPRLIAGAAFLALSVAAGTARADPCEATLPRRGAVFEGVVRYVGDGDSLCVANATGWVEIRVQDFSAPELSEPRGREGKAALERVAMNRRLRCVAASRSYDRIVATCTLQDGPDRGRTLGQALRRAGAPEGGR